MPRTEEITNIINAFLEKFSDHSGYVASAPDESVTNVELEIHISVLQEKENLNMAGKVTANTLLPLGIHFKVLGLNAPGREVITSIPWCGPQATQPQQSDRDLRGQEIVIYFQQENPEKKAGSEAEIIQKRKQILLNLWRALRNAGVHLGNVPAPYLDHIITVVDAAGHDCHIALPFSCAKPVLFHKQSQFPTPTNVLELTVSESIENEEPILLGTGVNADEMRFVSTDTAAEMVITLAELEASGIDVHFGYVPSLQAMQQERITHERHYLHEVETSLNKTFEDISTETRSHTGSILSQLHELQLSLLVDEQAYSDSPTTRQAEIHTQFNTRFNAIDARCPHNSDADLTEFASLAQLRQACALADKEKIEEVAKQLEKDVSVRIERMCAGFQTIISPEERADLPQFLVNISPQVLYHFITHNIHRLELPYRQLVHFLQAKKALKREEKILAACQQQQEIRLEGIISTTQAEQICARLRHAKDHGILLKVILGGSYTLDETKAAEIKNLCAELDQVIALRVLQKECPDVIAHAIFEKNKPLSPELAQKKLAVTQKIKETYQVSSTSCAEDIVAAAITTLESQYRKTVAELLNHYFRSLLTDAIVPQSATMGAQEHRSATASTQLIIRRIQRVCQVDAAFAIALVQEMYPAWKADPANESYAPLNSYYLEENNFLAAECSSIFQELVDIFKTADVAQGLLFEEEPVETKPMEHPLVQDEQVIADPNVLQAQLFDAYRDLNEAKSSDEQEKIEQEIQKLKQAIAAVKSKLLDAYIQLLQSDEEKEIFQDYCYALGERAQQKAMMTDWVFSEETRSYMRGRLAQVIHANLPQMFALYQRILAARQLDRLLRGEYVWHIHYKQPVGPLSNPHMLNLITGWLSNDFPAFANNMLQTDPAADIAHATDISSKQQIFFLKRIQFTLGLSRAEAHVWLEQAYHSWLPDYLLLANDDASKQLKAIQQKLAALAPKAAAQVEIFNKFISYAAVHLSPLATLAELVRFAKKMLDQKSSKSDVQHIYQSVAEIPLNADRVPFTRLELLRVGEIQLLVDCYDGKGKKVVIPADWPEGIDLKSCKKGMKKIGQDDRNIHLAREFLNAMEAEKVSADRYLQGNHLYRWLFVLFLQTKNRDSQSSAEQSVYSIIYRLLAMRMHSNNPIRDDIHDERKVWQALEQDAFVHVMAIKAEAETLADKHPFIENILSFIDYTEKNTLSPLACRVELVRMARRILTQDITDKTARKFYESVQSAFLAMPHVFGANLPLIKKSEIQLLLDIFDKKEVSVPNEWGEVAATLSHYQKQSEEEDAEIGAIRVFLDTLDTVPADAYLRGSYLYRWFYLMDLKEIWKTQSLSPAIRVYRFIHLLMRARMQALDAAWTSVGRSGDYFAEHDRRIAQQMLYVPEALVYVEEEEARREEAILASQEGAVENPLPASTEGELAAVASSQEAAIAPPQDTTAVAPAENPLPASAEGEPAAVVSSQENAIPSQETAAVTSAKNQSPVAPLYTVVGMLEVGNEDAAVAPSPSQTQIPVEEEEMGTSFFDITQRRAVSEQRVPSAVAVASTQFPEVAIWKKYQPQVDHLLQHDFYYWLTDMLSTTAILHTPIAQLSLYWEISKTISLRLERLFGVCSLEAKLLLADAYNHWCQDPAHKTQLAVNEYYVKEWSQLEEEKRKLFRELSLAMRQARRGEEEPALIREAKTTALHYQYSELFQQTPVRETLLDYLVEYYKVDAAFLLRQGESLEHYAEECIDFYLSTTPRETLQAFYDRLVAVGQVEEALRNRHLSGRMERALSASNAIPAAQEAALQITLEEVATVPVASSERSVEMSESNGAQTQQGDAASTASAGEDKALLCSDDERKKDEERSAKSDQPPAAGRDSNERKDSKTPPSWPKKGSWTPTRGHSRHSSDSGLEEALKNSKATTPSGITLKGLGLSLKGRISSPPSSVKPAPVGLAAPPTTPAPATQSNSKLPALLGASRSAPT